MNKQTIRKNTIQIAALTLLSRGFGVLREILMVRYLGVSGLSDAFLTAFKIPNLLRKAFAEGALSAAFIPTVAQIVRKDGPSSISSMMTLGFILFEGLVLLIVFLVMLFADTFLRYIVPGFTEAQIQVCVPMLRVLMPFIFFISSSALLAGPLQAVNHFFVPAFGPILLNIVFIIGLLVCLFYKLPVIIFCWFVIAGGFLLLVSHLIAYLKLHFRFGVIESKDVRRFGTILIKFLLCLPAVSIMEVNSFIDTSFASYLVEGSISLINYANRFVGIPLGVFAVAFSTTLLPHVSRVSSYAPKRLHYYLFESTKVVLWVTLPVVVLMWILSDKIFLTFLPAGVSGAQIHEAATIMKVFLIGLFFFSINKILLNMFYALHMTWIPGIISVFATGVNILFNWLFLDWLQAIGLVWATVISAVIQTVLFFIALRYYYNFSFYFGALAEFLLRSGLQLVVMTGAFLGMYSLALAYIMTLSPWWVAMLNESMLFWVWVGPIAGLFYLALYFTRKVFGIKMYFMD
jgi:putative peptidoglycan lipid II flippase